MANSHIQFHTPFNRAIDAERPTMVVVNSVLTRVGPEELANTVCETWP